MIKKERFRHAVPDPALRGEIAYALNTGERTAAELAVVHGISIATVRRYAQEAEVAFRLSTLPDHVRGAMIAGCRAGGRHRWERQYGPAVVAAVLSERGE